jgi:molecular chaperone DnaJ
LRRSKSKTWQWVQAPGVSYRTCSTCNGQGQLMQWFFYSQCNPGFACPTVSGSGPDFG